MKKYLQIPSLKAWQLYYEYNKGKTYQELGTKYGVTREKVRSLVVKVQRYLYNGNVRILTEQEVLKQLAEQELILENINFCK